MCPLAFSGESRSIPGWAPFKFGQTLAQAQAAAGPRAQKSESGVKLDVEIDGQPFSIEALAGGAPAKLINRITLAPVAAESVNVETVCEQLFEQLAEMVSARFGKSATAPSAFEDLTVAGRTQQWLMKDQSRAMLDVTFQRQAQTTRQACSARIDLYPGKNPAAVKK
jgi:hypothetical protein